MGRACTQHEAERSAKRWQALSQPSAGATTSHDPSTNAITRMPPGSAMLTLDSHFSEY
jgi:hypothetical protein